MKANLATEVSLETNFSVIACRVLHTLHSSARSAGIEGGGPQSLDGRGGERRPRGGRAWPTDACRPRRRQGAGVQRPRSLPSTWKPGCAEHQNSRDLGVRPSIAGRQGVERRPRGGRAWPADACRPRRRQGASVQRPRSLAPTWKSGCAERQNSGD